LVALHGSWNRSTPAGYAVVALDFADDGRITERPFLDGFRGAAGLIGRPVDVVEAGDGAIYVSDDYAGVIYRLRAVPSSSSDG
jgi:glucose/arabinose dehydrogenase